MRIEVTAGPLANALSLVTLALDDRQHGSIQSLGAIALRCAERGVELAATNVDHMVVATAEAEVIEPGEVIAVAGKRLAGLIQNFAPDASVRLTARESFLEIKSGRAIYKVARLPTEDLPAPLAIEAEAGRITTDRAGVARLLSVAFAASTGEVRYYLNGIYLHRYPANRELLAVATDGKQLARISLAAPGAWSPVIVPRASVKMIDKLVLKLPKADTAVTLRCSTTLIEVATATVSFTSRLIAGRFPDYARVIPRSSDNILAVARTALTAALARLAAVVDPQIKAISLVGLEWGDTRDTVRLSLLRQGDAGVDEIKAEISGHGRVALMLDPLRDILNQLGGERVTLNYAGDNGPVLIGDPADPGLLMLRMPAAWFETAAEMRATA